MSWRRRNAQTPSSLDRCRRRAVKKLFAIALDYDGTIAFDDTVDSAVRDAIAALRAKGITVLLVTGRILDDLRRAANGCISSTP